LEQVCFITQHTKSTKEEFTAKGAKDAKGREAR